MSVVVELAVGELDPSRFARRRLDDDDDDGGAAAVAGRGDLAGTTGRASSIDERVSSSLEV